MPSRMFLPIYNSPPVKMKTSPLPCQHFRIFVSGWVHFTKMVSHFVKNEQHPCNSLITNEYVYLLFLLVAVSISPSVSGLMTFLFCFVVVIWVACPFLACLQRSLCVLETNSTLPRSFPNTLSVYG